MKVNIIDNDLLSIQEARILAENAYEAQQKLATFPQEKLDEIVEAMAQAASSHEGTGSDVCRGNRLRQVAGQVHQEQVCL